MTQFQIYYYLKRMDEDLQDELKPKLAKFINLDSDTQIGVSLSTLIQVGIIHASQRSNVKNIINALNLNLVIFLIQGAGKPKEAKEKYRESFPHISLVWECGTEYLIEHFDKLEKYLKATALKDWSLKDWISSELQQLSALAILCQGYLAIYDQIGGIEESSFSLIKNNLSRKKEQVSEAKWWLDVFDLRDEKTETIVEEKWRRFESAIAREWNPKINGKIPDAVTQLLKALHESSTKLKQPKIVAEAYRAIATWLESQIKSEE